MSNSQKKEQTQLSDVFSIDFDDLGNDGMPGVTRLINPELIRQKAAAQKTLETKKSPTEKNVTPPLETFSEANHSGTSIDLSQNEESIPTNPKANATPLSLSEIGVQVELQFQNERGYFRFTRFKDQQSSPKSWQESFFAQMKLDLNALGYSNGFKEFQAKKESFHQEVFGLSENEWIQMIRTDENASELFVLISDRSLLDKQQAILNYFKESRSSADSHNDSIKIELG